MLERLFARNVPEERIDDAVDHGRVVEEQDALRTRSAVILERLARKQAAARQEEVEARRVAREAADRAAEAPTAMPAETSDTETPAAADASAQATQASAAASETAQQDSDAPSAMHEESGSGVGEARAETAMAGRADFFSDDAPLRSDTNDSPEMRHEVPQTERPDAVEDFTAEPPAEPAQAEPEFVEPEPADPVAQAQPAHTVPDIHDDPDALERIRQKAEEAKARIAARLQQMGALDGSAGEPSNGRIDIGENAPPVSPDGKEG